MRACLLSVLFLLISAQHKCEAAMQAPSKEVARAVDQVNHEEKPLHYNCPPPSAHGSSMANMRLRTAGLIALLRNPCSAVVIIHREYASFPA